MLCVAMDAPGTRAPPCIDVVEAPATEQNRTVTLLSNHVARGANCSEMFRPQGFLSHLPHYILCRACLRVSGATYVRAYLSS